MIVLREPKNFKAEKQVYCYDFNKDILKEKSDEFLINDRKEIIFLHEKSKQKMILYSVSEKEITECIDCRGFFSESSYMGFFLSKDVILDDEVIWVKFDKKKIPFDTVLIELATKEFVELYKDYKIYNNKWIDKNDKWIGQTVHYYMDFIAGRVYHQISNCVDLLKNTQIPFLDKEYNIYMTQKASLINDKFDDYSDLEIDYQRLMINTVDRTGEKKMSCDDMNIYISKNRGYIYFKPIIIEEKQIKINLVSRGNVQLQFLNENTEWEPFCELISCNNKLIIRAKMEFGSVINSIVVSG